MTNDGLQKPPHHCIDLKLNRPAGLQLDYNCTCVKSTAADNLPERDLDGVASAQPAADRWIEHCATA
jgi:hypothetical protein